MSRTTRTHERAYWARVADEFRRELIAEHGQEWWDRNEEIARQVRESCTGTPCDHALVGGCCQEGDEGHG